MMLRHHFLPLDPLQPGSMRGARTLGLKKRIPSNNKLIGIGEADDEGRRAIFYELNGMPRESQIVDTTLAPKNVATRAKGDQNDPLQAVAPMPGMVTEINAEVGTKVKEGNAVVTVEAMKMLTTISEGAAGTVTEIHASKGEAVEPNNLLAVLER